MLSKAKDAVKVSKGAELLQRIPLGVKVKLLLCLVVALVISPMVAAVIEGLIVRFTALEDFAFFAVVQTVISLLTTSLIILFLINILVMSPIFLTMTNTNKIREGNLVDFAAGASRDELGSLSTAIYNMKEELRSIVLDVRKTAQQIKSESKEIEVSIESNVSAVEQIAASTNDFSSRTDNINTKTKNISEVATNIASGLRVGGKDLNEAATYAEATKDTINNSAEQVQELNLLSDKISSVIQIITDISEETHLLSFNASIEAARAGEHGRGFAVVADQIGKLADQSKKSAAEIRDVVYSIQGKTGQAVEEIIKSEEGMDRCTKMVSSTASKLNSIIAQLESLFEEIEMISGDTEEISASTQEIAASTQEQSASLQEVSTLTNGFQSNIEQLETLLDKFSA